MLTRLLSRLRGPRATPAVALAAPPAPPTPTRPQLEQIRPCRPVVAADGELPEPDRHLHVSRLRFGDYIDRHGCVEMVVKVDNTDLKVLTVRTDHAVLTFPRAHRDYARTEVAVWYSRPEPRHAADPTEPF